MGAESRDRCYKSRGGDRGGDSETIGDEDDVWIEERFERLFIDYFNELIVQLIDLARLETSPVVAGM